MAGSGRSSPGAVGHSAHSVSHPTIDSPPVAALVERWYEAFSRRDLRGLCEVAHEDIEIRSESPLPTRLAGATFRGHPGVRTLMEWSFARYPSTRVTAVATRRVGSTALAQVTYATETSTGLGREFVSSTLFDGDHNSITRIRVFTSESQALAAAGEAGLSERQREVLQLLARGLNARQIAESLVLSPATVRTHVRNAVVRLGARTRVEAIAIALKRGDIQL